MIFRVKHAILKYFILAALIFGVTSNVCAQNARKDNFFADIKSIDLIVGLDGDLNFCKVRESDIRSAVGYTLANSPLRRIDKSSLDKLYIGLIVLNNQGERGTNFGCSIAFNIELWRYANFKGSINLVTVWSQQYLLTGSENSIGAQLNSRVEREVKDFVAKWAEQN